VCSKTSPNKCYVFLRNIVVDCMIYDFTKYDIPNSHFTLYRIVKFSQIPFGLIAVYLGMLGIIELYGGEFY
jgi:hypothetical protein